MICTINVQEDCNVCCRRQIFEEIHANLSLKSTNFCSFLSLNLTWKVGFPLFWFPPPQFFFRFPPFWNFQNLGSPPFERGGTHYGNGDELISRKRRRLPSKKLDKYNTTRKPMCKGDRCGYEHVTQKVAPVGQHWCNGYCKLINFGPRVYPRHCVPIWPNIGIKSISPEQKFTDTWMTTLSKAVYNAELVK